MKRYDNGGFAPISFSNTKVNQVKKFLFFSAFVYCVVARAESASPWVLDDPTFISDRPKIRATIAAFAANDFAVVTDFTNSAQNPAYQPKLGTNRALGTGQAGAYYDQNGYEFGVFRRFDAFGIANSDAITVIQTLKAKTSVIVGRTYPGSYSYQVLDMDGIRLGKSFSLPMPDNSGWTCTVGVSVSPLHGISIRQDNFSGTLYASTSDSFLLSGQRIQSNSTINATDYNVYLHNGSPSATGYTSDYGLSVQNTNGFRAYLISDLASELHWQAVPSRSYSVQGFTGVLGSPLPSGYATTAPFSSNLTMKTTAGIAYPFHSFELEGAVTHIEGINDSTLAVTHSVGWGWNAGLSIHPYWHALGVSISNPAVGSLRLISDNTNVNQAHVLGLMFNTGFAF